MGTLLSVIMTVYNAADYLRQSIGSILEQSYEDFELIIVDDGSLDESAEIIEGFRDARIRFVRSRHKGRVDSLNSACQIATGDFLAIADADDISHPDRLAKQLQYFERFPECDVVGSWVQVIDANGNDILLRKYPVKHHVIFDTMPYACSVAFPASMFRRAMLTEHGLFNPAYIVAHDLDFWLRILPESRFHNLPDPLLNYRISRESLARKHAETARRETLSLAHSFLKHAKTLDDQQRDFGRARVDYYHGELRSARNRLAGLLRHFPFTLRYWRFFIPTLLGSRLHSALRRSRLSRLPGWISRHLIPGQSLSPP